MPAYLRSRSSKDKNDNNTIMAGKEQEKTTSSVTPPAESPVFTLGAATPSAKPSTEASKQLEGFDLKLAALSSRLEDVATASHEAIAATRAALSTDLKTFQADIIHTLKMFKQHTLEASAVTEQTPEDPPSQLKAGNPSAPSQPPSASLSPSGVPASSSESTPAPASYPFASLAPAVDGVGRPSGVKSTPVLRARELFGFFMNGCTYPEAIKDQVEGSRYYTAASLEDAFLQGSASLGLARWSKDDFLFQHLPEPAAINFSLGKPDIGAILRGEWGWDPSRPGVGGFGLAHIRFISSGEPVVLLTEEERNSLKDKHFILLSGSAAPAEQGMAAATVAPGAGATVPFSTSLDLLARLDGTIRALDLLYPDGGCPPPLKSGDIVLPCTLTQGLQMVQYALTHVTRQGTLPGAAVVAIGAGIDRASAMYTTSVRAWSLRLQGRLGKLKVTDILDARAQLHEDLKTAFSDFIHTIVHQRHQLHTLGLLSQHQQALGPSASSSSSSPRTHTQVPTEQIFKQLKASGQQICFNAIIFGKPCERKKAGAPCNYVHEHSQLTETSWTTLLRLMPADNPFTIKLKEIHAARSSSSKPPSGVPPRA